MYKFTSFRRLGCTLFRNVDDNVVVNLNKQRRINKWLFSGIFIAGTATLVGICLKDVNCVFYDILLKGFIKYLDPELSHDISVLSAKYGISPVDYSADPPILHNNIGHLRFFSPIGMAAGFDKNAEIPLQILRLGFGFIEVGTILPEPQYGNPKPRIFRLNNSYAVINSCGFNSVGLNEATENIKLARRKQADDALTRNSIIGISVGPNKKGDVMEDVNKCIQKLAVYSDYIAINISSPNTPNLRDNERREPLVRLIKSAKDTLMNVDLKVKEYINTTGIKPLLFVKISPDVTRGQLEDIAHVVLEHDIDGVILTNTTVSRIGVPPQELESIGNPKGGLSGKPLKSLSQKIIHEFYELTSGKIPIIACGGISDAKDALDMIEAGASACQLYTALIYQGPKLPSLMKRELANMIHRKGYKSLSEAIGAAHRVSTKNQI